MTNIIMVFIICALVSVLLIGMQYRMPNINFFNKENTNTMRGFWCLIIILVHIPVMYENRIQDMIGSFAYIGVTFFFMTSAYGLKLLFEKKTNSIIGFWKKRLPKLIVPCLMVNLFEMIVLFPTSEYSIMRLLHINDWVKWLLMCYFIFWFCYKIGGGYQDTNVSFLIIMMSLFIYWIKLKGIINGTTWCTEVFGFIWGLILANYKNKIINFLNKDWSIKLTIIVCLSCILGVGYLKLKTILFLGDYILKILLGITIIFFLLIINVRFTFGNRISEFLGKISYEVYLTQWVVIPLINIFKIKNSGIYILIVLFVTVVIAFFIYNVDAMILKIIENRRIKNV